MEPFDSLVPLANEFFPIIEPYIGQGTHATSSTNQSLVDVGDSISPGL